MSLTKFSVHTTFVTGRLVQTDVLASSKEEAMAKQIAKFPAGSVDSVSAWPAIRESVTVNVGSHRAPAFDSSFGLLV